MFSKGKSKEVHEYLLAPNFHLGPRPNGPLELGHTLDDPQEPRLPLNRDETATSMSAVRSQLDKSEFKIWARLADLVPVGGDGTVAGDKSSTDLFEIKTVEATYFLPSSKYLEASVKIEDVRRFLEGGLWRNNIYIVTGLKVARNGSVTSYTLDGKNMSAGTSVDFKQLGIPFTAGASEECGEMHSK
ncbi:hypothetical protein B0H67DRAFT_553351 [Lasiosphaeris hirsuta]|uniref:Uncharacterized protein n=1 Tax=Lasiosphaeris hirsuta TaxID=260670 RepID=A0AA40DSM2_9PEZI|nr:hypothetical protein B0H67DRAFT_553351 [Lasiosphaeris hirsuta]